jgi:hypothetical protein
MLVHSHPGSTERALSIQLLLSIGLALPLPGLEWSCWHHPYQVNHPILSSATTGGNSPLAVRSLLLRERERARYRERDTTERYGLDYVELLWSELCVCLCLLI